MSSLAKNRSEAELVAFSYESMAKGSLSFSFASRIFKRRIRDRVVMLYAWCRYVDNEVDEGGAGISAEARRRLLDTLAEQSFAQPPPQDLPAAMAAFRAVRREVPFPEDYARELMEGMAMDLGGVSYETEEQLYLYCYRVAGVVGLMMSYLMEVSSEQAYRHATDLGLAMQLTNICRDINTDEAMGRIYLPRVYLQEAGFELGESLLNPAKRPELVRVVAKTLDAADRLYRSGDEGLKFLPIRCALAVAVAREVYSGIGDEIRARGGQAWDRRTWLPLPKKIALAFRGIGRVLQTLPYRLRTKRTQLTFSGERR